MAKRKLMGGVNERLENVGALAMKVARALNAAGGIYERLANVERAVSEFQRLHSRVYALEHMHKTLEERLREAKDGSVVAHYSPHPPVQPETIGHIDRLARSAGAVLDEQRDQECPAYAAGHKAGWKAAVEWYAGQRA